MNFGNQAHACRYASTYTYIRACTHTHIYTYTHTYKHRLHVIGNVADLVAGPADLGVVDDLLHMEKLIVHNLSTLEDEKKERLKAEQRARDSETACASAKAKEAEFKQQALTAKGMTY